MSVSYISILILSLICPDHMSRRRVRYRYIFRIDGQGKLQSGYIQVHRQDAALQAATGSVLVQIDISMHHVHRSCA